MKYYKQWKGYPQDLEDEGEPVGWFKINEVETLNKLLGNIREWNGRESSATEIKSKLAEGQILQSSCALYIGIV